VKTIVLGGGCFWCVEAIFQQLKGVESVISGYAGGTMQDPTYHNHDDHAEVIQVTYDENLISLQTLFEVFFHVHNPTTPNRQGNDVGTAYRSIILVGDEDELELARQVREEAQNDWDDQIVTEMKLLDTFYEAEDYHQDYYNQNQSNPYCQVVIDPKLAKFRAKYQTLLKEEV
jgi:methionine-S-sulfoxide reductase